MNRIALSYFWLEIMPLDTWRDKGIPDQLQVSDDDIRESAGFVQDFACG
jgi:hypothetical protein